MVIGIDIGAHDRYYTPHLFMVSKEHKKDTKLLMQNHYTPSSIVTKKWDA